MFELHDFSVTYPDGTQAVRGVNMAVPSGEIVAIVGASGSGKSTLLRGIAGLEATSGQVLIDGEDISRVPTHRRGVGMVFQDGQLFAHMNVEENIRYGMPPATQADEEVREWLKAVDLSGFEGRAVSTLSGGQAQRVALARSLAARPRVLLLDEPLSALDADLRENLSHFVRGVLKKYQVTALYVTHNQDEAAIVADSVMRMDNGILSNPQLNNA